MADGRVFTIIVLVVPGLINLATEYASFLRDKVYLYEAMDREERMYELALKCVQGEIFEILMFYHHKYKTLVYILRQRLLFHINIWLQSG